MPKKPKRDIKPKAKRKSIIEEDGSYSVGPGLPDLPGTTFDPDLFKPVPRRRRPR